MVPISTRKENIRRSRSSPCQDERGGGMVAVVAVVVQGSGGQMADYRNANGKVPVGEPQESPHSERTDRLMCCRH